MGRNPPHRGRVHTRLHFCGLDMPSPLVPDICRKYHTPIFDICQYEGEKTSLDPIVLQTFVEAGLFHLQQLHGPALVALCGRQGAEKRLFLSVLQLGFQRAGEDGGGFRRTRAHGGEFDLLRADDAALAYRHRPLDDVAQLPDIARPSVLEQLLHCRAGELFGRDAVLGADGLGETAAEEIEVRDTLTQGRDAQGKDVDPVVEILPETALAHGLPQVLIGGGEDTHVHIGGLGGAHAVKPLVLDGVEQLDLGAHGDLADLVEEDGAAVRLLKVARLSAGEGSGKGSAHIAEELALKEVPGDGAAVDLHEGAVGPGETVNLPGQLGLAGAALPCDDDVAPGLGSLEGQIFDPLDGGRAACKVGKGVGRDPHGLVVHVEAGLLHLGDELVALVQQLVQLGEVGKLEHGAADMISFPHRQNGAEHKTLVDVELLVQRGAAPAGEQAVHALGELAGLKELEEVPADDAELGGAVIFGWKVPPSRSPFRSS